MCVSELGCCTHSSERRGRVGKGQEVRPGIAMGDVFNELPIIWVPNGIAKSCVLIWSQMRLLGGNAAHRVRRAKHQNNNVSLSQALESFCDGCTSLVKSRLTVGLQRCSPVLQKPNHEPNGASADVKLGDGRDLNVSF